MFQRTDFPLILLLRRKYLAIGGVGGGVMLMSMVSTLRYTSKILGEDSNTRSCLPEYATLTSHSTYFKRLNMGARARFALLSRMSVFYGRVPCLQSSVFRAVFAFGFAALRKLG